MKIGFLCIMCYNGVLVLKWFIRFMKKVFVLFALLFLALPCFASAKLLYSYSSNSIYYYYMPDFKPENFKKPLEVQRGDFSYTMFIYSNPVTADKFKSIDNQPIPNKADELFSMLIVGIKNKPDYYVFSSLNDVGYERINICKLDNKTYNQIKYTNDTENGDIVKQMVFNNGEFNIVSVCNPDYVPGSDI